MASEVWVEHDIGLTLYYQIRHPDGKVRDVVNGAWDTFTAADWADYVDTGGGNDLHFTEVGTNSGIYRATFPALDANDYSLRLFEQAGGAPASTDERIGDQGIMHWNGTAEIEVEAMRGTDSANTTIPDAAGVAAGLHGTTDGKIDALVTPDAAGVAAGLHDTTNAKVEAVPTTDEIDAKLSTEHGSGQWTSDLGTGPNLRPYTVTVNGQPLADCRIWITTDRAGVVTPRVASGYTNSSGVFTFRHSFAAGTILYVWRQKTGYNFTNPDQEEI